MLYVPKYSIMGLLLVYYVAQREEWGHWVSARQRFMYLLAALQVYNLLVVGGALWKGGVQVPQNAAQWEPPSPRTQDKLRSFLLLLVAGAAVFLCLRWMLRKEYPSMYGAKWVLSCLVSDLFLSSNMVQRLCKGRGLLLLLRDRAPVALPVLLFEYFDFVLNLFLPEVGALDAQEEISRRCLERSVFLGCRLAQVSAAGAAWVARSDEPTVSVVGDEDRVLTLKQGNSSAHHCMFHWRPWLPDAAAGEEAAEGVGEWELDRRRAPDELDVYLGEDSAGRVWCGDTVFASRCREGGEGCEGWRVEWTRLSRAGSFFPMAADAAGRPRFHSEDLRVVERLPFRASDISGSREQIWRDCDEAKTVPRRSEESFECFWTSDNLKFRSWFTLDVAAKAGVAILVLWFRKSV